MKRANLSELKKYPRLIQCAFFNNDCGGVRFISSGRRVPPLANVSWSGVGKICRSIVPHRFYCVTSDACWNCQALGNNSINNLFFCENCGSLLEVTKNPVDYFKLLGLKTNFNIAPTELTSKFREIQNIIHPDKFSSKSDLERTNSVEWSSLINQAYKTLSVPIKRAEYILQQHGIKISEDNSSMDKEFLIEMMDKNEEVAEAHTKSELNKILSEIQRTLKELFTKFETNLQASKFNDCKSVLIRMKYFSSIENTIKTKIYELN